jgi:hypothetical protein
LEEDSVLARVQSSLIRSSHSRVAFTLSQKGRSILLQKWCLLKCKSFGALCASHILIRTVAYHQQIRTNLAIIVVAMQLAKKIPFDDPDVLLIVRGMYVLSNVLILGIYLYTQAKIKSKKGMVSLDYANSDSRLAERCY